MQKVYNDGNLGKVEDFDLDSLYKILQNPMVDHVRVFEKEAGVRIEDEKDTIVDVAEIANRKRQIETRLDKLHGKEEQK